jgi:hypothetical protein
LSLALHSFAGVKRGVAEYLLHVGEATLVARLARDFPREHEPSPIGPDRAPDAALITAPEARDPKLLKKLDAVAGRILRAALRKQSPGARKRG